MTEQSDTSRPSEIWKSGSPIEPVFRCRLTVFGSRLRMEGKKSRRVRSGSHRPKQLGTVQSFLPPFPLFWLGMIKYSFSERSQGARLRERLHLWNTCTSRTDPGTHIPDESHLKMNAFPFLLPERSGCRSRKHLRISIVSFPEDGTGEKIETETVSGSSFFFPI